MGFTASEGVLKLQSHILELIALYHYSSCRLTS